MVEPVFEVYSEVTGRLQFALLARLPELIAVGTHNSTTNQGTSNTPGIVATRLVIPGLRDTAFIAVRPNGSTGFAFTYAERINGETRYNFLVVGGPGSFDYWVFDYPPVAPATSGVVFETYDGSGAVLARLHMRPAIAAASINQVIADGSFGDAVINVPAGRRYAVAVGMRSGLSDFSEIGTPDGQAQRYRYNYRLDTIFNSGNTLVIGIRLVDQSVQFYTDPNQVSKVYYYTPRNNMVLDVTNY